MLILCLTILIIYLLAWCTCHAYGGFYVLQCLFLCLTIFTIAILISLGILAMLMGALFLKMLIICLTILIFIYWLGVLAMLIGAFISWNAYLMPYYIY